MLNLNLILVMPFKRKIKDKKCNKQQIKPPILDWLRKAKKKEKKVIPKRWNPKKNLILQTLIDTTWLKFKQTVLVCAENNLWVSYSVNKHWVHNGVKAAQIKG